MTTTTARAPRARRPFRGIIVRSGTTAAGTRVLITRVFVSRATSRYEIWTSADSRAWTCRSTHGHLTLADARYEAGFLFSA
jgi:hypothetical protein